MDLCWQIIMSLLLHMLSRLVIIFLSRSKRLLISWLQSPSAVILDPPKIKSATVSTVSPIYHEVMGPDAMILVFWKLSFKPTFSLPVSLLSRGSLVPLHFLPWGRCYLHIWGYWYFFWQSWSHLWFIQPGNSHDVLWYKLNMLIYFPNAVLIQKYVK